ncbi:uncharacterized protein LOC114450749 [Parambassis ranga]|uniref:Uncharacterized protein LOC114450749 n=1 Tax=Parambassis ranga TaxID=210632 RepID=A0A6P7K8L6_9TELE|nr:uncharacterized protein LOC114450749 [Parambassis ranga]
MMTSAQLVFCLMCLFLGKMAQKTNLRVSSFVQQVSGFIPANAEEDVTLQCFYHGDESAWLFWYMQALGERPRLISALYMLETRTTFYDEFNNNPRFTLDTENGSYHLTIKHLRISDSATYYCAQSFTFVLTFAEGVTVSVKDPRLNFKPSVSQSVSESIQPGGSVTLNCTVHTGTCDGEHSVYWVRQSEESRPGLIYTHGGRNDQCERKVDTQTHTCVYNLTMKNLNLSHAGTYYCAVASCGHIILGNRTTLNFKNKAKSLVLVYFLSGAWALTTLLAVSLAFSLYKIITSQSKEPLVQSSSPVATNQEDCQDADSLHYAALNVKLPNRSRRQRNTNQTECVYSGIKE